jgi:TRAP-type C4-dicarboxylate transport system permease small subunit
MRKFVPTAQDQSGALELLAGLLFVAVVAMVLFRLTTRYGLLPTDALDYSDILLAP